MISHLFFADDRLIFFKLKEGAATSLKHTLLRYESLFGQAINYEKYDLLFSKHVPTEMRSEYSGILGVRVVDQNILECRWM